MTDERFEGVHRFALLKDFSPEANATAELLKILEERKFPPRSVIISEDDTSAQEMFFLVSGKLTISKISKAGEIVRIGMMDGADHPFFGEAALLGVTSRSASVEADTLCKCLCLKKSDFESFAKKFPSETLSFYRRLAEGLFSRIQKADKDLLYLGTCGKT